jgi:hypothetical protein
MQRAAHAECSAVLWVDVQAAIRRIETSLSQALKPTPFGKGLVSRSISAKLQLVIWILCTDPG